MLAEMLSKVIAIFIPSGLCRPLKTLCLLDPMKLNIETILEAVQSDENIGFCRACGQSQGGVEPDAKNYKCANCGEMQVFGAEELLIELTM